ncbi:MAG: class I SAM-dependent methyltransferase [Lachnospiraceae bacterium]|nr:class I SAM-dependent methyltransferase [Lachnospiraceae bacterium]
MNITEQYYHDNSQEFFEATINADTTTLYDHFLKYVPEKGYILDLGCGSGRDTRAFLNRGYKADAIDGSKELCALASEFTGIKVKCMDFSEIDEGEKYDAIWACASLLHVEKDRLPGLIERLSGAVKVNGAFYMSFKYGDFEGERDGRFFMDMTAEKFHEILKSVTGWTLIEEWDSEDVRRGKNVKWYNAILQKVVIA